MFSAQPREGDTGGDGDAALAPHVQTLRGQTEPLDHHAGADCVDQRTVGMLLVSHAAHTTRTVYDVQPAKLIAINAGRFFTVGMEKVAARMRQRISELGITQADAARASGCSTARFGNYMSGTRKPDLDTIVRIAKALKTSTDWLLGVSETVPVDTGAVFRRLLELDGMPENRACVIAEAAQEALRLLSALPDEGDARTRSLVAAQAAWQMRPSAKPS